MFLFMKNILTIKRISIITLIVITLGMFMYAQRSKIIETVVIIKDSSPEEKNSTIVADEQVLIAPVSSSDMKIYTHPSNAFSFEYPVDLSVSSFGVAYDELGETILVQDNKGKSGVQVIISLFDEDVVLTEERIHRDIPDLVMLDVHTRTLGVGEKKIEAVVFASTNSSVGKSTEAWFVHGGQLYQVSAPRDAEYLLSNILTSWKF